MTHFKCDGMCVYYICVIRGGGAAGIILGKCPSPQDFCLFEKTYLNDFIYKEEFL